ncbi:MULTISPECIES: energy-coupled thiamine transporter ThiT [unclassified Planococcus (in: firmicutes)]|uniref:energy-coupled thiamine transporter ThiT n=1 Tax=Planococcus TaxID=1372 RepID=UPI000C3432ED|nr:MULTISPECIES: energy-coupled thiamine transporter ThiT [unclassified Planococcus (in: firmicutes)]AUD13357.1 energy-coupled thiamine transporter ThiT [Planococcus sp. MB-3u-03]PKG44630.1 energy-coupled thiamine transporter ThiT [Planococcus sp. Urea-trap-24]PKG89304.1 energy-coupled thiamine transporter ThiT [Planococcus sp. Urea-3u-39]PKH39928.1 energy-coupled thiamine transporter ThiT [Planococcus sp. MB-3u-09]
MRNKRVLLMVEIAIFAALGFVLDFIAFRMPQGGSVSLVMIPIVLMAFRRGVAAGVVTGLLVGLLQIVTGFISVAPLSFGFVVMQVILDYLLAYGVVGLAGMMRGRYLEAVEAKKTGKIIVMVALGVLIGSFLRYVIHVITGILFFGMFADGNVFIYSAVYNATYMIPVAIVAAIVCSLLFITAPRLTQPDS